MHVSMYVLVSFVKSHNQITSKTVADQAELSLAPTSKLFAQSFIQPMESTISKQA